MRKDSFGWNTKMSHRVQYIAQCTNSNDDLAGSLLLCSSKTRFKSWNNSRGGIVTLWQTTKIGFGANLLPLFPGISYATEDHLENPKFVMVQESLSEDYLKGLHLSRNFTCSTTKNMPEFTTIKV